VRLRDAGAPVKRTAAFVAVVAFFASAIVPLGARAQLPQSDAERLMKEGQELLERGQYGEACARLDLSLKREDSVNTLALLAFCHERAGKPGKAWNEFRRVEPRVPPGDKAVFVAQHLRALEGKVARARLDVGDRTITEVRVDNDLVALEAGKIVADPGDHTVRVVANGVTMAHNARLVVGDNPDIVMSEPPAPPPVEPAAPASGAKGEGDRTERRKAGLVVGGAGAVLLGVGVVEGLKTIAIKKDADALCGGGSPSCTSTAAASRAADRRSEAVLPSWIATGGVVLGAAGLATAIYLMVTSRAEAPAAATTGGLRVTPVLGPSAAGVSGSF